MNEKIESFVSVAVVIKNQAERLETFLKEVHKHIEAHFADFEIVLVDQCSSDGTVDVVHRIQETIPSIRFLALVQEVSEDTALAAAVENAIGDVVVLMDIEEDPVESIVGVVETCMDGYDVVVGVAERPRTLGYRLVRPYIRWVLEKIGYKLPRNASHLRCLTRRAVNAVTQSGKFHHQFFMRISNTGYKSSTYNYTLRPEAKKRTLYQGIRQMFRLLVFNSTQPLRWMSAMGFLASISAFIVSIYSVVINLIRDDVVEGWTSIVLFMSFMFMMLFIILAFFGEYLGRLLDDKGKYKDYTIAYESNSNIMVVGDRINVLEESER